MSFSAGITTTIIPYLPTNQKALVREDRPRSWQLHVSSYFKSKAIINIARDHLNPLGNSGALLLDFEALVGIHIV
jgi:hypothetical protein